MQPNVAIIAPFGQMHNDSVVLLWHNWITFLCTFGAYAVGGKRDYGTNKS